MGGPALVERHDQRLGNRRRAIERQGIGPRLQIMRQRQMPLAKPGGLIIKQTHLHPPFHTCHRLPKFVVSGSIVDRVAADLHQQVNLFR